MQEGKCRKLSGFTGAGITAEQSWLAISSLILKCLRKSNTIWAEATKSGFSRKHSELLWFCHPNKGLLLDVEGFI